MEIIIYSWGIIQVVELDFENTEGCWVTADDSTSFSSQQVSVVWQLKAYETVVD
jgi:hypothetical protein